MTSERDAELDEALIGGREKSAIVIADYDAGWPARFDELALQINAVLSGKVLFVEHIGSTAVPGLSAKPIIDILLTVASLEGEGDCVGQLESAGFVLRVRESGHRMFRTAEKDVHIHIYERTAEQITDYRDLRDWLRVSEADCDLYSVTKRQLAQQEWTDMNYYADAKTAVIQEILGRARDWRATKRA